MIDLEAIQKRADAATSGPWMAQTAGMGIRHSGQPYAFVVVPAPSGDPEALAAILERMNFGTVEDVQFVAAARQDVPALLRLVRIFRPVVASYLAAFKPDDSMALTEKLMFQEVEDAFNATTGSDLS